MSAEELATDALAVARITRLIAEDHVPFGPSRERFLERNPQGLAAELLGCPWCLSMWVAGFVFVIGRRLPGWRLLARVLAASYLTGYLSRLEHL